MLNCLFAVLVCLLMPNRQIDPGTSVAANPAAKREEGHVILCSALWTCDSHVADPPDLSAGIDDGSRSSTRPRLPGSIRLSRVTGQAGCTALRPPIFYAIMVAVERSINSAEFTPRSISVGW